MFRYNLVIIYLLVFIQVILLTEGVSIKINKAPYQAQVELTPKSKFLAHAVILNCKWAVTAASAVYGLHPKDIKIRSGSAQLGQNGGLHSVRDIIIHEEYKKNMLFNDIALIQIFYNFHLSKTVCPITFAETRPNFYMNGHITGWWKNKKGTQIALEGPLQIVPTGECLTENNRKVYGNHTAIVCTTPVTKSPVGYGISLIVHGKLQGLLMSPINENSELPFKYTDISAYVTWINNVLSKKTHYNIGSNKEQCEGYNNDCVLQLFDFLQFN